MAFNGLVWKTEQEQGHSLSAPLAGIPGPVGLKEFESELRKMHMLG